MKYVLYVSLVVAMMLAAPNLVSCAAQSHGVVLEPQKGISVNLPISTSAVAFPDADQTHALLFAITRDGRWYLGTDAITADTLVPRLKEALSRNPERKVYLKADALTSYANVVKVLDGFHTAGVDSPVFLTGQQQASHPGEVIPPTGLEFGRCR